MTAMGSFFVGSSISGVVPSGRGATNYLISSATPTLRLSFSVADMVVYDPTYDLRSIYDLSINGMPFGITATGNRFRGW